MCPLKQFSAQIGELHLPAIHFHLSNNLAGGKFLQLQLTNPQDPFRVERQQWRSPARVGGVQDPIPRSPGSVRTEPLDQGSPGKLVSSKIKLIYASRRRARTRRGDA